VPTLPNETVIEAMIKGPRPGPTTQYFARKPPQTLEKLLQKMDEYIRVDNGFRQRREEAYRYSEMTRGFEEDFIPGMSRQSTIPMPTMKGPTMLRAVNTTHSLRACNKLLTDHQLREAKGGSFGGGRYSNQPRKLSCLFCGEDKGHTTRTCQVTIQKQKEFAKAEARQNQSKQVLHTASCYSPYIPEYVGNQQATASAASVSHSQAS
jgi:hypothetical protein